MTTTDPATASKPLVLTWLPILSIVFGAGGLVTGITLLFGEVDSLKARLVEHERLDMHEGARHQLELLEQRQAVAEMQLREARAKTEAITENFHKINRRLDAMCAAIPRCERQK
jgi:hypothetical protein